MAYRILGVASASIPTGTGIRQEVWILPRRNRWLTSGGIWDRMDEAIVRHTEFAFAGMGGLRSREVAFNFQLNEQLRLAVPWFDPGSGCVLRTARLK